MSDKEKINHSPEPPLAGQHEADPQQREDLSFDAPGPTPEELAQMQARKDKILRHIDRQGWGIEIGPSHSPIAPKREGYNVHIIDHLNREQLIEKYTGHEAKLENIEEVDFIWTGQPYAELTGKKRFYDWVIASHVIEHTTDLIGFLQDCDSIMKEDAVISLVIPDKRYCFDHFRPLTGISQVIDAHFQKNTIHSPGTVAEYYLNVVSKGGQIGWDYLKEGRFDFVHPPTDAIEGISKVIEKGEYIDVHSWCFTPYSFRLLIHDLNLLELSSFREMSFLPTSGNEFYLTLARKGQGPGIDRMEMLEIIETEAGYDFAARDELERILASKSWKITGPLRKIRSLTNKFAELVKRGRTPIK